MKIVQINSICGGSTGKIAHRIAAGLDQRNIENYILYAYGNPSDEHDFAYSMKPEIRMNALRSRILGNYGFNSGWATKRLIRKLEEIRPDIIHLHVAHSHDVNIEILCDYLADKKVVWTMHDCWLFTGYCPYYTYSGCDNWKTECHDCRQKKQYSWFWDCSNDNFNRKKKALHKLENLTVVTPSSWLMNEMSRSFLKSNRIHMINNGIDLNLFHRMDTAAAEQDSEKKMVLCVGLPFGERKGIRDVLKLAEILPEEYRIVIVGAEKGKYPENITAIERTENQQELVEYYNHAHVLLNPTHEDNFPTVNLEALACGTPVITYNVGGSPESLDDRTGIIVEENDIIGLKNAVLSIKPDREQCRKRAELLYSDTLMADAYFKLYQQIDQFGADF